MGYNQIITNVIIVFTLLSVSVLNIGGCGGVEGCNIKRRVASSSTCKSLKEKYGCNKSKFRTTFGSTSGFFNFSGTCKLSGCKLGCDNSDDVSEPQPSPSPEPEPTDLPVLPEHETIVTTPDLLTPINNESIEQNNPNIGCPFDPTFGFGSIIFFDWTDSSSPNGISGYHLFVMHTNASIPLIDTFVTDSNFTYLSCNSFVSDINLDQWIWTVEAEDNLGNFSDVSRGEFIFEPCRLSNGDACSAPF